MEGVLYQKVDGETTPLRIVEPDDDLTAMRKLRDEMATLVQRCQSMMLIAAENPPDEEELDAIEARVEEIKAQIETQEGE